MQALILKSIKEVANSIPGKLIVPIAYALLSFWLPAHFAATACNRALWTCMAEELVTFWEINKYGASANLVLRIIDSYFPASEGESLCQKKNQTDPESKTNEQEITSQKLSQIELDYISQVFEMQVNPLKSKTKKKKKINISLETKRRETKERLVIKQEKRRKRLFKRLEAQKK